MSQVLERSGTQILLSASALSSSVSQVPRLLSLIGIQVIFMRQDVVEASELSRDFGVGTHGMMWNHVSRIIIHMHLFALNPSTDALSEGCFKLSHLVSHLVDALLFAATSCFTSSH